VGGIPTCRSGGELAQRDACEAEFCTNLWGRLITDISRCQFHVGGEADAHNSDTHAGYTARPDSFPPPFMRDTTLLSTAPHVYGIMNRKIGNPQQPGSVGIEGSFGALMLMGFRL